MSLRDLIKKGNTDEDIILKVDQDPEKTHEHDKRPGYQVVSGWLESGDETFVVLTPEEVDTIPEKDGYINLKGIVRVKKNKINKKYIERINPLPAMTNSGEFANPFAKK